MYVSDIKIHINLKPLKLSVRDTPHLTIEPNLTCNIRCRACYNLNTSHEKSVDEVKAEIDLGLKKRNLETITILGGEPTLHPGLIDIISYIKSKKLICQLLTNGIVFLQDKEDKLLDSIIKAGVDRILLHIDIGQSHVHKDIEKVRETLFSLLEKKKVFFSASTTIFFENRGEIPSLMKKYARYKYFDGILSLLARNTPEAFSGQASDVQNPELLDEYQSISDRLAVEPAAYIPSSLDDCYISWLMYFYYINAQTKKTFCVSPELNRLFRNVYRLLTGRHVFGMTTNQTLQPVFFILTSLIDITFHPKKIVSFVKILRRSSFLRALRFHYILIQSGPEFNVSKDQIQLCYHCPDATIRNRLLTPVCAADIINPLGKDPSDISRELYQVVYEHLEEI